MHLTIQRQQLKSSMLPLAIIGGAVFYKWMGYLSFISPYLIFLMLFITYCKLDLRSFKPSRGHLLLLVVQCALSAAAYFLVLPIDSIVAEGIFICIFMPTATAAPVITAMLGGSISFVATYSLLCNLMVAVVGPVVLAAIGDNTQITFLQSTLLILSKVFPLLILPLACALLLRYVVPKAHAKIVGMQQLSFYIWTIALFIIVGNCVSFIINHWDDSQIPLIIMMVIGAFIACVVQFACGRHIGKRLMERLSAGGYIPGVTAKEDLRVSCAQSLMQKNTVIGVWLAMAYMTPLASVGPAAYIAWHNIINSWQLWKHESRKSAQKKNDPEKSGQEQNDFGLTATAK